MLLFSINCWHVTQQGRVEVWCWCLNLSLTRELSFHCLVYMRPWSGGFFVPGTLKSQSITLHFIANLSQWQQMEKVDKGGEEGVAKRPVVTLMEWKQKPGVWLKHPAWSKAIRYSQLRQGCFPQKSSLRFLPMSCLYPALLSSWHAWTLTNKVGLI